MRGENTPERKFTSTGDQTHNRSWLLHAHHWATRAGPVYLRGDHKLWELVLQSVWNINDEAELIHTMDSCLILYIMFVISCSWDLFSFQNIVSKGKKKQVINIFLFRLLSTLLSKWFIYWMVFHAVFNFTSYIVKATSAPTHAFLGLL